MIIMMMMMMMMIMMIVLRALDAEALEQALQGRRRAPALAAPGPTKDGKFTGNVFKMCFVVF